MAFLFLFFIKNVLYKIIDMKLKLGEMLTEKFKSNLYSIIISIFSTAIIAMSLSTIAEHGIIITNPGEPIFKLLLYFGLALIFSGLRQAVFAFKEKYKEMLIYRIANAVIHVTFGVLTISLPQHSIILTIAIYVYFGMLGVYNLLSLVRKHNVRQIIWYLLLAGCVAFVMTALDISLVAIYLFSLQISAFALGTIIYEAFSKMQFGTLLKIIRKTYALEILLGLLFLILSFSFVFMAIEGMKYTDALWYCFAVVTTIGFGDFTTLSTIGRILSVILGIYGLIVVAVITSVIVNFYNESKHHSKKEEVKQEDEEKEKEKSE